MVISSPIPEGTSAGVKLLTGGRSREAMLTPSPRQPPSPTARWCRSPQIPPARHTHTAPAAWEGEAPPAAQVPVLAAASAHRADAERRARPGKG